MLGNGCPSVGHIFKHNFPKKPSAIDYFSTPRIAAVIDIWPNVRRR